MVNFEAVFIANGAAVVLLLVLLASSRRTQKQLFLDDKLFVTMVTLTILQCIIETAAFYVDGKTYAGYKVLALLLNTSLFSICASFSFLWVVYADFKLFGDYDRLKKRGPWLALPALVVILGSIANLFTPVFYRMTPNNVYVRESLYILPYIVTYLYLTYGVLFIYKYKDKVNKYLFMPALLFMAPIALGSIIQFVFYGIGGVWLGTAIALVSLYINLQSEITYVDSMSGLFTRQYMNHYLEALTQRQRSINGLAGIMLDIDRFKSINDNFGHLVGDAAIRDFGNIIRSSIKGDAIGSRFAGDEFMIILENSSEQEVKDFIAKLKTDMDSFNATANKPYKIGFSVGYSMYLGHGDSVDSFLQRVDDAMYANKRAKIAAHLVPDRRSEG